MAKPPKTRDYLMVKLIQGATKSGPHQVDGPVKPEPMEYKCQQCHHYFWVEADQETDGFCSDQCQERFDDEFIQEVLGEDD